MSEIKEDGASFVGYEYKEIPAGGERASLYLDGYQNLDGCWTSGLGRRPSAGARAS